MTTRMTIPLLQSALGRRVLRDYQRQLAENGSCSEGSTAENRNVKKNAGNIDAGDLMECAISNGVSHPPEQLLPPDFLRIPRECALRVWIRNLSSMESTSSGGAFVWKSVAGMQRHVLTEHERHNGARKKKDEKTATTAAAAAARGKTRAKLSEKGSGDVFDNEESFEIPNSEDNYYTAILDRDIMVGLGLTVREKDGHVYVHALLTQQGKRLCSPSAIFEDDASNAGPAQAAGILPGDRILGCNGTPFLRGTQALHNSQSSLSSSPSRPNQMGRQCDPSSHQILESVANALTTTPDPVAMHLSRRRGKNGYIDDDYHTSKHIAVDSDNYDFLLKDNLEATTPNDTSISTSNNSTTFTPSRRQSPQCNNNAKPNNVTNRQPSLHQTLSMGMYDPLAAKKAKEKVIHPFATALKQRRLLKSDAECRDVTKLLDQFTLRTRQWESTSRFCVDGSTMDLRPHFDPRDMPHTSSRKSGASTTNSSSLLSFNYSPSTPTLSSTVDLSELSKRFGLRINISDMIGPSEVEVPLSPYDEDTMDSLFSSVSYEAKQKKKRKGSDTLSSNQYPGSRLGRNGSGSSFSSSISIEDIEKIFFVHMNFVRKSMCIRIVNSFAGDNNETAYTVWVYDVESGTEWYAPVRYFRDFKELRTVTSRLCESVNQLPFPNRAWNVLPGLGSNGGNVGGGNGHSESDSSRFARCQQLEHFLRGLCAMVYRGPLHRDVANVATHLQSFVGCDTCLRANDDGFDAHCKTSNGDIRYKSEDVSLLLHHQVVMAEGAYARRRLNGHDEAQMDARLCLKRSIQRYVYRIFLLPTLDKLTTKFIATARSRVPTVDEMRALDRRSMTALKESAMSDLHLIRDLLDQLQNVIFDGTEQDLISLSERAEFAVLHPLFEGEDGSTNRDSILQESIREQIEIEVYVPLRSAISRELVNGWRHDDMEMQFKIQALKQRPQSFFKIPPNLQSPSEWQIVSDILSEGVSRSTLPCAKLRAIVDAAKEISTVFEAEHNITREDRSGNKTEKPRNKEKTTLGADDFLPIFIFCVVRAEIERPCALCALLQTFCDPSKKIGETGYYLASFEAAISHIRELDLAEVEEKTVEPTPS